MACQKVRGSSERNINKYSPSPPTEKGGGGSKIILLCGRKHLTLRTNNEVQVKGAFLEGLVEISEPSLLHSQYLIPFSKFENSPANSSATSLGKSLTLNFKSKPQTYTFIAYTIINYRIICTLYGFQFFFPLHFLPLPPLLLLLFLQAVHCTILNVYTLNIGITDIYVPTSTTYHQIPKYI